MTDGPVWVGGMIYPDLKTVETLLKEDGEAIWFEYAPCTLGPPRTPTDAEIEEWLAGWIGYYNPAGYHGATPSQAQMMEVNPTKLAKGAHAYAVHLATKLRALAEGTQTWVPDLTKIEEYYFSDEEE